MRYIAIITIGAGGGSFATSDDPEDAARKAAKLVRRDWGKLYYIPKPHDWRIPVYDITDRGEVYWDHGGVFTEATNERIERHSLQEITA